MYDIRKIYRETFRAIKNDTKLLDLLKVKYKDVDENTFLTNLRTQVIESTDVDDLLNNYSTRLCIHELTSGYSTTIDETSYLAVDIYITQDRNMQTGLLSDIVKRVIEIFDTKERQKQGLEPLDIGLYGLTYRNRIANTRSGSTGWLKHTLVFKYTYTK